MNNGRQEQHQQTLIEGLSLNSIPKNDNKRLLPIPGVFYGGGCCYMACRGLAMSPISDVLVITHGPVGCAYFSWDNSRAQEVGRQGSLFASRSFSTAMTENDVIFGGEQKLALAIEEAVALFQPPAIAICATCPVGLIGDDIDKIAQLAEKKFGITVIPLACEGFKNVPGYKVADLKIVDEIFGSKSRAAEEFSINIVGEFYTGKNKQEIDALFEQIGYHVVSALMGVTTIEELRSGHTAALTIVGSDKAIDDVVQSIEEKYGIGWIKVDFTGLSNIIGSLRDMADYFGDQALKERTEAAIKDTVKGLMPQLLAYQERFVGLTAALFEDCFKSDHFLAMLVDLGVEVILISQDYARNEVTDEGFLGTFPRQLSKRWEEYVLFNELSPQQENDRSLTFLLSRSQVREFLELLGPDLCFSGITQQFEYDEKCIKSRTFNSEERGVQYAGVQGFLQFAQDLEMSIFISHWETDVPEWERDITAGELLC
ncbi:MAG: nitrogenase component 1 [Desulfosporosinus sp.]|nr:nitrogenase component 1 [Desulfosporosinus sp.]